MLLNHVLLRRETARGETYCASIDAPTAVVFAFCGQASDFAVAIFDEFGYFGAIDDLAAQRVDAIDEKLHSVATAAYVAARCQIWSSAVVGIDSHGEEADAHVVHPIDHFSRVLVHCGLVRDFAIEAVELGIDAFLDCFEPGIQAHADAVVEATKAIVLLQFGTCGKNARIRHAHRAARNIVLFEQHDFVAVFKQACCSHKTGSACAHKYNIDVSRLRRAVFCGLGGAQREVCGVAASIGDCVRNCAPYSHAGHSSARNCIGVEIAGFENTLCHHGTSNASYSNSVVVANDFCVSEFRICDGYRCIQIIFMAHCFADPFAIGEVFGRLYRALFGRFICFGFVPGLRASRHRAAQRRNGSNCDRSLKKVPSIEFHVNSLLVSFAA